METHGNLTETHGEFVDLCIKNNGKFLIPILEQIQDHYRYLPEDVLNIVAEKMNIPFIDVYSVATFYQAFSLKPKGKHTIIVCLGTACYIRGGAKIVESLSRDLNLAPGTTSDDNELTLETVNCLGCCAIGPIVVIDGKYHGEMTPQKTLKLIKTLKEEKK
jgi:NADH-quinone oxidoreductase subunit E